MPTDPGPGPIARATRARGDRRSLVPFIVAFAVVALGFGGSTLYGELRAGEIDREIAHTQANALPSMEGIVGAQTALRHIGEASEAFRDGTGDERRAASAAIDEARKQFDIELGEELATDYYPTEHEAAAAVADAQRDLDAIIARMRATAPVDGGSEPAFSSRELREGIEHLGAALDHLLAVNASGGRRGVERIVRIRDGSMRVAFGLDALCMAFSILAAAIALRALRSQQKVERAHEEMLEVRAEELEMFARRVAHDLLGPLSALSFTLSAVRRNTERKAPIEEPLQRAFSCLKRSQRLVDGVLDFARSGAAPPAGGRASLREVVLGVVEEVSAEANGTVAIELVPWTGDVVFPCAPGILGSVLSNLLRNAVKYMGGSGGANETSGETENAAAAADGKRITIRVFPDETRARVEIEDTGPGIPESLTTHIFEPYVRAPDNTKPGLGLGLATVRRFVEAYGGRIGLESIVGEGSTFWFELPRAPERPLSTAEPTLRPRNGVTTQ